MADDVAQLVGDYAEAVENRGLLLDKFVFHKLWPPTDDDGGRPVKWDEASRWSFMRIADGASTLLQREASSKEQRAGGKSVEPHNRQRLLAEAQIARRLANVRWSDDEIQQLRSRHTRRFLRLFRQNRDARSAVIVARLEGRLAINLADSLIQNAGICLDRLFGLPFVPGSAIKGVCRHAALEELRSAPEADRPGLFARFRRVFGTADNDFANGQLREFRNLLVDAPRNQRGAVSFLPAYPLDEARIVVDLTNVHYPDYYRTGQSADLANEKPRPNPFPAVEAGVRFAFCLALDGAVTDHTLLTSAQSWLVKALTEKGLGAKTASGYGWFSIDAAAAENLMAEEEQLAKAAEEAQKHAEQMASLTADEGIIGRLAKLKPDQLRGLANKFAFEDKFWPKSGEEAEAIYQLSLLVYLTERDTALLDQEKPKGQKSKIVQSLQNLAAKFNRVLPT